MSSENDPLVDKLSAQAKQSARGFAVDFVLGTVGMWAVSAFVHWDALWPLGLPDLGPQERAGFLFGWLGSALVAHLIVDHLVTTWADQIVEEADEKLRAAVSERMERAGITPKAPAGEKTE